MATDFENANNINQDKKQLLWQIVSYIPGTILPAIISLCATAIYTRIFGTIQFGQYSLILSVVVLIVALSSQWLQQSINRYISVLDDTVQANEHKNTVALGLIIITSILIILLFLGFLLMPYIPTSWRPFVIPSGLLVTGMSIYNPLSVVLQAEMKARLYSKFKFIEAVLRLLLSLMIIFLFYKQANSIILGSALSIFILIPFLWKKAKMPTLVQVIEQDLQSQINRLKTFTDYGFPMIGWFLSATLLNVGDRYIIQWFRGASEVGIYSANYQLIQGTIGLLSAPVLLAAHPFLMKSWGNGDRQLTGKLLGEIVNWFVVVGMLLFGITVVLSSNIANWFLGLDFRQGHTVMPIVVAGYIAWQIGMYAHKPLEFTEKTSLMLKLSITTAILNLVLNTIFVPIYGYLAAAYTTLVSFLFYLLMVIFYGRRILSWNIRKKQMVFALFINAITTLFLLEFKDEFFSNVGYLWGFTGIVIVYGAVSIVVLHNELRRILGQ